MSVTPVFYPLTLAHRLLNIIIIKRIIVLLVHLKGNYSLCIVLNIEVKGCFWGSLLLNPKD